MTEAPVQPAVFCDDETHRVTGLGAATMPDMRRDLVVSAITLIWRGARAQGMGLGRVFILDPEQPMRDLGIPPAWSLLVNLCLGRPDRPSDTPQPETLRWNRRTPDLHIETRQVHIQRHIKNRALHHVRFTPALTRRIKCVGAEKNVTGPRWEQPVQMTTSELICVGAIGGAFGVHGEVRLKSFCAVPSDIADYSPLMNEDGSQSFAVTLTRPIKNGFAGRVGGITTKEQADALRGQQLYARRDQLPSLPDDEFYHTDLIGLEVVDTGGARLGHVKSVQNHGAGDLLELEGSNLSTTILLPFTRTLVLTVDLDAGRIVTDPPEGLL